VPLLHAVSLLPPPPLGPQPGLVCAQEPDLGRLSLENGEGVVEHARLPDWRGWRPRLGRGGRLVLDRCRPLEPFWREPGTPDQQEGSAAAAEAPAGRAEGGEKAGGRAGGRGRRDKESGGGAAAAEAAAAAAAAVKEEPQDGAAQQGPASPAPPPAALQEGGEGAAAETPPPGGGGGGGGAPSWSWDQPLWEQPNPYAQWLSKQDLAQEALTRLAGTPAAVAANPPLTALKSRSPAAAASAPGSPAAASAATPGAGGGAAATPASTAASRGAGPGRPPLPPAGAAAPRATPGTAGSARRDTRRPAKTTQKSNLGPGSNGNA
jgi:hypothetical protein